MTMQPERKLSDRAVQVADDIIGHLDGLPAEEGLSVLISILSATLNGQAGNDANAEALWQAACLDLRETMQKGRLGIFQADMIQ